MIGGQKEGDDDFILYEEAAEDHDNDDKDDNCCEKGLTLMMMLLEMVVFQLTHMMTWTTISPVLALSYFSRLYPPHPLTQQFAVRVLRTFASVSTQ